MNMKRNLVILFVLVALVGMASAKSKAGKESVNITLDQKQLEGKPEAVMSAWMGYGMARANWISASSPFATRRVHSSNRPHAYSSRIVLRTEQATAAS